MPGGFGTLDEFFEALTLIQTNKIGRFPIAVYSTEFHKELTDYIENMVKHGTIAPEDKLLYLVSDNEDAIVEHIRNFTILPFGLKFEQKAWWLLGEHKIFKRLRFPMNFSN